MLIDEKTQNKINKEIDKKDKRLKKGFWAGLLAFFLAKITHLLVTLALGLWIGMMFVRPDGTFPEGVMNVVHILDGPIVGIAYLVFVTRLIYKRITKDE